MIELTPLEANALLIAIKNYIRKSGEDLANNHPTTRTIISNLQHIISVNEKIEKSDANKEYNRLFAEALGLPEEDNKACHFEGLDEIKEELLDPYDELPF